MDILLVNPPLSLKERYGKFSSAGNTLPSLGLCCLAASCREAGFSVGIYDFSSLQTSMEEALDIIKKINPKIIGITATTTSIISADNLCEKIKIELNNIKTIIGGAHITALPIKTMEMFNSFDIGVIGEGDNTLVELLNSITKSENLREISGIVYREEDRLILSERKSFISDLDTLPMPAWDLLPDFPKAYFPPVSRFVKLPAYYLTTSRGCPMACTFCDRSVFGKRYRLYSPEYVFKMITDLYDNFGIKEFLFEDDCFTVYKQRIIDLCKMIINSKMTISWSCLGRVDMVDDEMIKWMKRAGCWQISFGIESGDEAILKSIKKKISLKKITEAIKIVSKNGIFTKGFFILGLPHETKETINKTIKYAKTLLLDDITISFFAPFPGSEINVDCQKYGDFKSDWVKMNLAESVYIPNDLTLEELNAGRNRFIKEFYFQPRVIFSYIKRTFKHPTITKRVFFNFFSLVINVLFKK